MSTPDHTVAAPAPRAKPMRADARRNRERVLAAASEAFSTYGSDAQMDDVARAAGVGVGTVYRHFPTKEALVAELVRRRFETFVAHAREALDEQDPWEAFAGLLRRNAELMARDAAVREAISHTPGSLSAAAREREELLELARRLVVRAQRAGSLREDFSADDIPMIMCGLSSTMSTSSGFDWRRHLELILDGLHAR